MTKKALRHKLLQELRCQPQETRLRKSRAIARNLKRLSLYRRAGSLLCYVAIDGEVETKPILTQALADGKHVAVPVVISQGKRLIAAEIKDLHTDLSSRGPFQIPEPAAASRRRINSRRLDLLLVPGVAFDREGHRLGRGGGYFDRFLRCIPAKIPRVGLAFGFQVLKEIPREPHDQPMSEIVTEKGIAYRYVRRGE